MSALTTSPGVSEVCDKRLPRRIVCFCLDAVTQQKAARGGLETTNPGRFCGSPGFSWAWLKQAVCIMAGGFRDLFLWLQHEHNQNYALGRIGLWEETRATSVNRHDNIERPWSESGPDCQWDNHAPLRRTQRTLGHSTVLLAWMQNIQIHKRHKEIVESFFFFSKSPQSPLHLFSKSTTSSSCIR